MLTNDMSNNKGMWNIERALFKNQEWKSMKFKIDDEFVCQLLLLWQNAWHKQSKAVRDLFCLVFLKFQFIDHNSIDLGAMMKPDITATETLRGESCSLSW